VIPITKPYFGEEERRAVQLPLETGWVVQGPHVERFEAAVAEYTGAAHAVATSSGTTALHVAVAALGLGPGEEVIVPAFTWISTANVVEYQGATPMFVDIDLATYNLDTAALAAAVTERTVGIIPVHLFGLSADMDAVVEIARRHGLWVLEDCACSLGGTYRSAHTGTLGEAGCFSFHPRKSITTGEGGMIVTGRDDLAAACRSLRDHGASRSDFERHSGEGAFMLSRYDRLGYNVRLTDIQGALGCAQMERLDWILEQRRRVASYYDARLAELPWLEVPAVPDGTGHGYQAYVPFFRPEEPTLANVDELHERRNRLMAELESRGIATRQGTHAAALQGYYREKYGLRPEQLPNAYLADLLTLALPLYPQLTEAEQEQVVDELARAFV
jgi:dTDP-4-amino-4,6-dideoxygalactose transaminase